MTAVASTDQLPKGTTSGDPTSTTDPWKLWYEEYTEACMKAILQGQKVEVAVSGGMMVETKNLSQRLQTLLGKKDKVWVEVTDIAYTEICARLKKIGKEFSVERFSKNNSGVPLKCLYHQGYSITLLSKTPEPATTQPPKVLSSGEQEIIREAVDAIYASFYYGF